MSGFEIAAAVKGAQGIYNSIGPDKINEYVDRFLKGNLSFLEKEEDKEEIKIIKEESKKTDYLFYKKYLSDPILLRLVAMGLGLRRLKGRNQEQVNKIRKRIYKKYTIKGLHIAELAQTQIPVISRETLFQDSEDETLKRKLTDFFEDIDRYALFIRTDLSTKEQVEAALTKIRTFSPESFLLISSGEARRSVNEISESVLKIRSDYKIEENHSDSEKWYQILVQTPQLEVSLSDHLPQTKLTKDSEEIQ
jgi:hypothetical protein